MLNIFVGIVFIAIGVWMIANPDQFCRLEDHFRIKGEREYSDAAIFFMRFRGFVLIIGGIVCFFVQF